MKGKPALGRARGPDETAPPWQPVGVTGMELSALTDAGRVGGGAKGAPAQGFNGVLTESGADPCHSWSPRACTFASHGCGVAPVR